jgi:hypothetical protein
MLILDTHQTLPCLTDLTFEFIRRPLPLILSPLSRTFAELTLVTCILFIPSENNHGIRYTTLENQ